MRSGKHPLSFWKKLSGTGMLTIGNSMHLRDKLWNERRKSQEAKPKPGVAIMRSALVMTHVGYVMQLWSEGLNSQEAKPKTEAAITRFRLVVTLYAVTCVLSNAAEKRTRSET
uniref:Uncharacterized protein n=1 Tax=Glossina austeni TaxID=7395 RepID=A0A1A9VB38_GLOAU